jgi:hypothetical protein
VGVASWELGVGVLAWRKSWHSGRRLVGPSARWAGTCISISFLSLRAQDSSIRGDMISKCVANVS